MPRSTVWMRKLEWWQSKHRNAALPKKLLFLPFELREMILREILITDKALCRAYGLNWAGETRLSTKILATCHQLHVEGARILYTHNTFRLQERGQNGKLLPYWGTNANLQFILPPIPRGYLQFVKHIKVRIDFIDDWTATRQVQTMRVMKRLPSIETLVVSVGTWSANTLESDDWYQEKVESQIKAQTARRIRTQFTRLGMKVPARLTYSYKGDNGQRHEALATIESQANAELEAAKIMPKKPESTSQRYKALAKIESQASAELEAAKITPVMPVVAPVSDPEGGFAQTWKDVMASMEDLHQRVMDLSGGQWDGA